MPSKKSSSDWANWLGIMMVLLGLLSAAWHGNEAMKLSIVSDPPFTVANMPPPDCDEDELIEEGLSIAECQQLAFAVHDISVSSASWFAVAHIAASCFGLVLSLFSLVAGIALIEGRQWAPRVGLISLAALTFIDGASFFSVSNSGPLIRQMYLWTVLVWFFIHMMMSVIALVGWQNSAKGLSSERYAGTEIAADDAQGYSRTAVISHWLIAISILFLFISSWWMLGLPLPSREYQFRAFPFQLHKNLGITLVVLLVLLVYVRLRHRPSALSPEAISPGMLKLTTLAHIFLYFIIFACCLSGYLSSSYSGWGTTLWWMVELPNWGRDDEDLNIFFSDIHLWTCWILLALISAHIAGALYHAFRNDGVIRRMLHL